MPFQKGHGPCRGAKGAGPSDHRASEQDGVPQPVLCPGEAGPPATPAPGATFNPAPRGRPGERDAEGARPMTQPRTANVSGRGRRPGLCRDPLPGGRRAGRGGGGAGGEGAARARPGSPRARAGRAQPPAPAGPRRARSLTGLRRFSVTFFQSSSCSWCRKPMAGPRSGRLRAAAAALRAPPPAARRAARHRPRGAGSRASGPVRRWLRPGGRGDGRWRPPSRRHPACAAPA